MIEYRVVICMLLLVIGLQSMVIIDYNMRYERHQMDLTRCRMHMSSSGECLLVAVPMEGFNVSR